MTIVRSIAGLLVAVVVIVLLTGVMDYIGGTIFHAIPDTETMTFPADANLNGLCAWNVGAYLVVTLIASFLATVIAGHRPMLHAGILAGVIVCLGIAFFFVGPATYEQFGAKIPTWYLAALPIVGCIGALAGGKLRARSTSNDVS